MAPTYKVEELLAVRDSVSESAVSLEKFGHEEAIKGSHRHWFPPASLRPPPASDISRLNSRIPTSPTLSISLNLFPRYLQVEYHRWCRASTHTSHSSSSIFSSGRPHSLARLLTSHPPKLQRTSSDLLHRLLPSTNSPRTLTQPLPHPP